MIKQSTNVILPKRFYPFSTKVAKLNSKTKKFELDLFFFSYQSPRLAAVRIRRIGHFFKTPLVAIKRNFPLNTPGLLLLHSSCNQQQRMGYPTSNFGRERGSAFLSPLFEHLPFHTEHKLHSALPQEHLRVHLKCWVSLLTSGTQYLGTQCSSINISSNN